MAGNQEYKKTLKSIKQLNISVANKFKAYDDMAIDCVVDSYGQTYAQRIYNQLYNCSRVINVYRNDETGDFRLIRHRCHNRFCPICNHVESNNVSLFLQQDYDSSDKDKTLYYTVVFTMKNCAFDDFGLSMHTLSKAFSEWHKKYSRKLKYVAGLRTFEFTFNKRNRTMHPHIHLLLKFNVNNRNDKFRLRQKLDCFNFGASFAEFLPLSFCGLCDNIHSFHMIKDSQDLDIYQKAILCNGKYLPFTIFHAEQYNPNKTTLFEFSKYITKFNKLLCLSPVNFVNIYRSLKNFKTRAFLGEWRTWKKNINHEDGDTWIDSNSVGCTTQWKYYTSFDLCENINVEPILYNWLIEHKIIFNE